VYAKDREDIKTMQRSQRRDLARRIETLFAGIHKTDKKTGLKVNVVKGRRRDA
jgi:hypothetical protein